MSEGNSCTLSDNNLASWPAAALSNCVTLLMVPAGASPCCCTSWSEACSCTGALLLPPPLRCASMATSSRAICSNGAESLSWWPLQPCTHTCTKQGAHRLLQCRSSWPAAAGANKLLSATDGSIDVSAHPHPQLLWGGADAQELQQILALCSNIGEKQQLCTC